jgi:hypothetical protein
MDEETVRVSVAAHIAMVAEVEKGPTSADDLLGKDADGARKRVYADLVAWGIVIPPSFRWPTQAGIALIEGPPCPKTKTPASKPSPSLTT